jgi:hypothetical protein
VRREVFTVLTIVRAFGGEVMHSNLGYRTKVSVETAASTFRVYHDEDKIKRNQPNVEYYKPLLKHKVFYYPSKCGGYYMYHLL